MWTAIVPAVAALLGVMVGQFWQAKREDKRWSREQLREQEIRAREDRHRFAQEKRELYAKFLASFDEWHTSLAAFTVAADEHLGGEFERDNFDAQEVSDAVWKWASDHGYHTELNTCEDTARELEEQVQVVCPVELGSKLAELTAKPSSATFYARCGRVSLGYERAEGTQCLRRQVFNQMRNDLQG